MEISNAIITDTSLGTMDHGVMSAWLYLDYGATGQGFGGYVLDGVPESRGSFERRPDAFCGAFIAEILRVVGVDQWEKLKGKHVRAEHDFGNVYRIGNILKDEWFDPKECFEKMKRAGGI